jgi:peptidyl-dipeptidase A
MSHIHQFQFYRALCKLSNDEGPLHTCDFYGSKEAGEKLK